MSVLLSTVVKILLGVMVFTGSFLWMKDAPAFLLGTDPTHKVPEKSVIFYADRTRMNVEGVRETDQHIWNRIFALIDGASRYILVDMFLYNDFQGATPELTRPLSSELTQHLLDKKAQQREMTVTLITDPINTVYGGVVSSQFEQLKGAGIVTIETNLNKLRDSNLAWSSLWRPFFSWFSNSTTGGWLPHPFAVDKEQVTLRSWAALLNFKANHRKIVVVDEMIKKSNPSAGYKMVTVVTSANPHDGSSAHGNVALEVRDALWKSVVTSEAVVAKLSDLPIEGYVKEGVMDEPGDVDVTLLRERAIKLKVLDVLATIQQGDKVDIAMFYFSDRDIMTALLEASYRGASIRIILDPNKDAFGFEKNGIPNRPVARELVRKSSGDIKIRWCDTHGEQCHAKLFMGQTASSTFMLLGSANFTRRNLENFNLETSVLAERATPFTAWTDAAKYFESMWINEGGAYTTDYEIYSDKTFWKSSIYRMMEATGISTF